MPDRGESLAQGQAPVHACLGPCFCPSRSGARFGRQSLWLFQLGTPSVRADLEDGEAPSGVNFQRNPGVAKPRGPSTPGGWAVDRTGGEVGHVTGREGV